MEHERSTSRVLVLIWPLILANVAVSMRARSHTVSATNGAIDRARNSDTIPDLGRFKNRYELKEYLARGGQAEVWVGVDRNTNRTVVFRFPLGLCEAGPARCLVSELGTDVIAELRSSCSIAVQANERSRMRKRSLAAQVDDVVNASDDEGDEFVQCISPVSTEGLDPAFEVWSVAGKVTLAEGFFMDSPLGVLTMDAKRQVVQQLRDMIATLSDPSFDLEGTCCCLKRSDVNECTSDAKPNWFRRVGRYACPRGYVEKPEACGTISHHDVKFENVMLGESASAKNGLKATLIDFGAASKCIEAKAKTATQDWVPFWLEDPLIMNPSQCWSYDTYDIGMIWLITELLAKLPAEQLMCHAAIKAGLMGVSSTYSRELRTGASNCSDLVLGRAWKDARVREDALMPVHRLVRSLRLHLSRVPILVSVASFAAALESFIKGFGADDEELKSIPLALPPEEILGGIFELLQECPAFPLQSRNGEITDVILECRFRSASHKLSEAAASKDGTLIARSAAYMHESYLAVKEHESKKAAGAYDQRALEVRYNTNGLQTLWPMVASCDVVGVQHLINAVNPGRRWAYLSQMLPDGESLLAVAARSQCAKIVTVLLDLGVSPLQVEYKKVEHTARTHILYSWKSWPLSAVMAAASIPKNVDVLELLLSACLRLGASPESLSRLHAYSEGDHFFGPSLLSLVAATGDLAMLRLVLDVLRTDRNDTISRAVRGISHGDIPLLKAAETGRAEACRELLKVGANLSATDDLLRTPLQLAVHGGHVDTVIVLGETSSAELEKPGNGILHAAASRDDVRMLEVLLSLGANVNDKATVYHETALHTACRHGSAGAAEFLANISKAHLMQNSFGETALALSARVCTTTNVIKDGGDLTIGTPILQALLHYGPKEVLQIADSVGNTPLLITASEGQLPCLRALAKHMPVDTRGPDGKTALMVATRSGQGPAIEVLVRELGADVRAKDASGKPISHYVSHKPRMQAQPLGRADTLSTLADVAGSLELFREFDGDGLTVLGRWIVLCVPHLVEHLVRTIGLDCNSPVAKGTSAAVKKLLGWGVKASFGSAVITPLRLVRLRIAASWKKLMEPSMHPETECLLKMQSFLEEQRCDPQQSRHRSLTSQRAYRSTQIMAMYK